jgi:RNA ligase (TIGR02306 family)
MSTHEIPIIRIQKEPHPNADSLSIVRVFGYTVCVRTADWQDGELAAYVPPDYTVPTDRTEFAFLKVQDKPRDRERIKVKKLRGVFSQGLLVKSPAGMVEGQNALEALGIERYEPPVNFHRGETGPGPSGVLAPKYDVENWYRYKHLFKPDELVVATEKLHGASARYVYASDKFGVPRMFVGSHGEWKMETGNTIWHRALEVTPAIKSFCEANPGYVLYGEVYGQVQDLKYGCKPGEVRFAAFDVRTPDGLWVPPELARMTSGMHGVPWVPLVFFGLYEAMEIEKLSGGKSLVVGADHIREGVVIQPDENRFESELNGRLKLKIVSNAYLERA